MAKSWFTYISGDPSFDGNYVEVVGIPTCSGDTTLCAIYATPSVTKFPVITVFLYAAIKTAFNGTSTRNITLLKFF